MIVGAFLLGQDAINCKKDIYRFSESANAEFVLPSVRANDEDAIDDRSMSVEMDIEGGLAFLAIAGIILAVKMLLLLVVSL